MRKTAVLVILGAAAAATLAHGQSPNAEAMKNPEIVVTAQKYQAYQAVEVPNISMPRRADFLLARAHVVCDTRDAAQRDQELKTTLRAMIAAAAVSGSDIGLATGDEVVMPFDEDVIEQSIGPDDKEDSSRAILIIKTPIKADDNFDKATARIKAFVDKTQKTGRTEVLLDGTWDLTVVNPEHYRPDLLQMIAADAKRTSDAFGTTGGAEVEGLEHLVQWHQVGQLDLSLYIPYRLKLVPLKPS